MEITVIRENRKSIKAIIQADQLIVKAPYFVNDQQILDFVAKKQQAIQKQLDLTQRFKITDGFYLFDEYVPTAEFDRLFFISPKQRHQKLAELLQAFIDKELQALQTIKSFVYQEIAIRQMKASWGNCNNNQKLTFSFNLVHMPANFVKSVIAHEVAHLFVFNHSKQFYEVLLELCPNYFSWHDNW